MAFCVPVACPTQGSERGIEASRAEPLGGPPRSLLVPGAPLRKLSGLKEVPGPCCTGTGRKKRAQEGREPGAHTWAPPWAGRASLGPVGQSGAEEPLENPEGFFWQRFGMTTLKMGTRKRPGLPDLSVRTGVQLDPWVEEQEGQELQGPSVLWVGSKVG